jgi:(p)ppGpp synthase/HD superfamily hydrolase
MTQATPILDWSVQPAIDFARAYHDADTPGYFDDHVLAVYREVARHTQDPDVLIAAISHDVVEDTKATLQEILQRFGYTAAFYVDNVTDETGYPNRKAKKQHSYWKIRRHPNSILIKLCDRLDNLRRCMRDKEDRFGDMYVAEHYTFKAALWQPNQFVELWDEVDAMIEILKKRRK